MEKLYRFYENNKRLINAIILIAMFFVIFLSVYTTPLYDDDLVYINKWRSDVPISNLKDIFEFQIQHYFNWGGRTVAHTILQLLLLCPKPLSAFLNTVAFFILAFTIDRIALEKFNGVIYMLTLGLLYYLNPTYKESVMWLTGSANYLYTTVLILIALYPIVNIYRNKTTKSPYLYIPILFLAGWCNENISATLFLLIIVTIIYIYRNKIKAYYLYFYLLFEALGLALMILAPGNFVRASGLPTGIMSILYRGHGQLSAWSTWLFFPIVLLLILQYITYKKHGKISNSNIVLVGFSIISILAMVISPVYPQRATFGSFAVILIVIVNNVYELYNDYEKEITVLVLLIIVLAILSLLVIGVLAYARMYDPSIGF